MFDISLLDGALVFSVFCIGIALLMHIRKEARDAHGKYRK